MVQHLWPCQPQREVLPLHPPAEARAQAGHLLEDMEGQVLPPEVNHHENPTCSTGSRALKLLLETFSVEHGPELHHLLFTEKIPPSLVRSPLEARHCSSLKVKQLCVAKTPGWELPNLKRSHQEGDPPPEHARGSSDLPCAAVGSSNCLVLSILS